VQECTANAFAGDGSINRNRSQTNRVTCGLSLVCGLRNVGPIRLCRLVVVMYTGNVSLACGMFCDYEFDEVEIGGIDLLLG
jgi:hypothetical protein